MGIDVRYRKEIKKPWFETDDGQMRWRYISDALEVVGRGIFEVVEYGWAGALDVVGGASVSALRREVRRYAKLDDPDGNYTILLADVPGEAVHADETVFEPVSLDITPQDILVKVGALLGNDLMPDEGDPEQAIAAVVTPLLDRLKVELVSVDISNELDLRNTWIVRNNWTIFDMILRPPTRGRTVGDLYQLGRQVLAYLEAMEGRGLTARAAAMLVRNGHAAALMGQEECSWLEVKSRPYLIRKGDANVEAAKIELAQDVARFGNADEDAVILVGIGTRVVRTKHEELTSVRPVNLERINAKQHRNVIDSRVFPPIEGLEVETIPYGEKAGIMIIFIPRQPEEAKPFLVHGAIAGGRMEGSFISIVRRRGDDSIPVSAVSIHAALAAGRALLRRGELPRTREDQ
jgi:hypothetical protein